MIFMLKSTHERIKDRLTENYEKKIKHLSEQNDTLSKAIQGLVKESEKMRVVYDSLTDVEKDIVVASAMGEYIYEVSYKGKTELINVPKSHKAHDEYAKAEMAKLLKIPYRKNAKNFKAKRLTL